MALNGDAVNFVESALLNWNAANTVTLLVGLFGVTLSGFALHVQGKREKKKATREEFHRRVAVNIENALPEFEAIADDIVAADFAAISDDIFFRRLTGAQRKLARTLRRASDSRLCRTSGWESVGNIDYDHAIAALDAASVAGGAEAERCMREASGHLEKFVSAIRQKIEEELASLT